MITTTLNEIRNTNPKPCKPSWTKLLSGLGKTEADDDLLEMTKVLEILGLADTFWVLDETLHQKRLCLLFAADSAESVLHIFEADRPNDTRPRDAARGAAGAAARDAARDAAWAAARDAARDAAWAAARAAQTSRLRQYLEYGEAASDMPWETGIEL